MTQTDIAVDWITVVQQYFARIQRQSGVARYGSGVQRETSGQALRSSRSLWNFSVRSGVCFLSRMSTLNGSRVAECWAAPCGIAVNHERKVR
jgi:hypothetical protein